MTTLVLEFYKIETDCERKYATFYGSSKIGTVIKILIKYLNLSIVQFCQTHKSMSENV